MVKQIELSPRHGLNPVLGVCFFCHEETGEIGILGKMKPRETPEGRLEDPEAPRHAVLTKEPCSKCAERMKQGVMIVEAVSTDECTGRLVVMTEEWVNRCVNSPMKETMLKTRVALMSPYEFTETFGQHMKKG